MTNEISPRLVELTTESVNTYSSSRRNIMSDETTNSPDTGIRPQNITHEQVVEGLAGSRVAAPSAKAIEIARAAGYEPDTVTSKGPIIQTAGQVAENSLLENEARLDEAERLLRLNHPARPPLTKEQREAILEAHESGGSVFNLTKEELEKRIHVFSRESKETGEKLFTTEDRRTLVEAGIVAVPPNTIDEFIKSVLDEVDPIAINDPILKSIANSIKTDPKMRDYGMLEDFGEIVAGRAASDPTVDPEEAVRLRHQIRDILKYVDIKTGRVGRGDSEEEVDARFHQKALERNEGLISTLEAKATAGTATTTELANLAAIKALQPTLKSEQEERVTKLVGSFNIKGEQFTISTIKLIAGHKQAFRHLVNRLIADPLDAETGVYNLGFYGQNNFEAVRSYLAEEANSGGKDAVSLYQRTILEQRSIELFHQMNGLIVTGNLEGFTRGAEAIAPAQLDLMQGTEGSGVVMRMFDQEYQMLLARDGWINNENYGEMMGFVIENEMVDLLDAAGNPVLDPATGLVKQVSDGKIVGQFEGSVFSKFQKAVAEAKPGSELYGLKPWEVKYAYNVGKILHNLSLRPAEYISLGKYPTGMEQYASFPQEGMARLMNWMSEMALRFDVGDVRGGVEFAKMARENYQEQRTHDGFSPVHITKIGGKELEDFELPGMFGVSGVFSSWRQNLIILRHMRLDFPGGGVTVDGIEPSEMSIGALLDIGRGLKVGGVEFKKLSKDQQGNYYRALFLEGGVLRKDISSSLGVLLKSLAARVDDSKEIGKAKEEVRVAIWKQAALDNPLAVASYLDGLEYKDVQKGNNGIGYKEVKIFGHEGKATELGVDWSEFSAKIFSLREMRLQRTRELGSLAGYTSLQDLINTEKAAGRIAWDVNTDQKLLDFIAERGYAAASEFANVRFNFNPFMNDTDFSKIVYGTAGAEFYRRRSAGDLGSSHKSLGAFLNIMGNPAGLDVEKALEAMYEIVEGVGSPLGTEAGQEKVMPIFIAWEDFIGRGNNDFENRLTRTKNGDKTRIGDKLINNDAVRVFRKWAPVHSVLNILQKPNSLAQRYSTVEAMALDSKKKIDIAHEATTKGILNHHLFLEIRKKYGGRFMWRMLAYLLLDGSPVVALGVVTSLFKESGKDIES